jgi:hypothetical protein
MSLPGTARKSLDIQKLLDQIGTAWKDLSEEHRVVARTMAEEIPIKQTLANAFDALDKAILGAIEISESRMGIDHTGRQNISLFIFAKLIAHCISIMGIAAEHKQVFKSGGLLDHSSLAALSRVAIDAALMTMYISDPKMNLEEWDLRRKILRLHELFNRKRFLTAAGNEDVPFFATYEQRKTELRTRISELATGLGHATEKIKDVLKGQNVFIDGSRAAAREAGWNLNQFELYQVYLSNWVHSHPVTFLYADDQKISFLHPSHYQISVCVTALEAATRYLVAATDRMCAFTGNRALDTIGHLD